MVHLINYNNIILDNENKTVFLKNKGMRIGFGVIGKGYAAEMAKKKLIANKVQSEHHALNFIIYHNRL